MLLKNQREWAVGKLFTGMCVCVVHLLCFAQPLDGVTVFHLGNSHTWDLKPDSGLNKIFEAGGEELENDRQIGCGQSLHDIVNNPEDSCIAPIGYSDYVDALIDQSWDVVTLQPFPGASGQAEAEALVDLIDLARWRSSDGQTRYLVYCTWPIVPGQDLLVYDYHTAWSLPFIATDQPTLANREFFIYMMKVVRDEFPNLPVEAIPVGAVLEEFHLRALNGQIAGFSGAGALYRDRYHMNNVGHFIAALTTYCVITGNTAADLGTDIIPGFAANDPEVDHEITAALRLEIANLVDSIIAYQPFAPPAPVLNLSSTSNMPTSVSFKAYTGLNYTLKYSSDLTSWVDVLDEVDGNSSVMGHSSDPLDATGFWQLLSH
jgi:hypothetical protein